jgi:nucleotide-binding universal stress UspA family protein
MNSELAVVHINELPLATPFMIDPLSTESSTMVMEVMQAQEDANKKLFSYIQKTWGKEIPLHIYTKVGKPKDEILNTAKECGADFIILGTHGRVGFDHLISGSVAEGVVRHAICPVLIIPNKLEKE